MPPRYNTRSTAANAPRPATVPIVPAPSTSASSSNPSYADVVAAAPAAAFVATPAANDATPAAIAAAAPAAIVATPAAIVATPASSTVTTVAGTGVSAPPIAQTVPIAITAATTVLPSYAAVVAGALLPNSTTVECNPNTAPVITPTNDDHPRAPSSTTPHSPLDVLLDAAALAADSPLVAPVADDDRLFASQLFDEDAVIPTFNLDNFQPDLKVNDDDDYDDASSCNADLPVIIDTRKKPDVVIDLATAIDHSKTVDLTEAARFALGTTNHTKKYTTRKKALLSEFVSVLKLNKEKYSRFLVLTSDVPSTFPSSEPVEMVFILLRGEENKPDKIRSLNQMLIDWVDAKRLKVPQKNGNVFPAPSSLNTMVRTFLASTKDYYQWSFSQKDFGFDGGYNGFFAALCEKRRKLDVSYHLLLFIFCIYYFININSHIQYIH
jgi:hypothetical protein